MKSNLTLFFIFSTSFLFSQNMVIGKMTDRKTKEAILFGTVAIYQNGILISGTETDMKGNYKIDLPESGIYDFEFSYTGFQNLKKENIKLKKETVAVVNAKMVRDTYGCPQGHFKIPVIELDNTTQGFILTSDEVRHMPGGRN